MFSKFFMLNICLRFYYVKFWPKKTIVFPFFHWDIANFNKIFLKSWNFYWFFSKNDLITLFMYKPVPTIAIGRASTPEPAMVPARKKVAVRRPNPSSLISLSSTSTIFYRSGLRLDHKKLNLSFKIKIKMITFDGERAEFHSWYRQ